jgi:uncharacterized membrane protein
MMTVLHVVFGTVALLAVPAALLVRHGGRLHTRIGAIFTAAMFVVLFSAGFLWQAKGHLFLVPLSAVTAYLIFNAWRVIARRKRGPDPIDDRVDMLAAGAVMLAGLATAWIGVTASTPLLLSIRPSLIGIGAIAICFGINDVIGFRMARARFGWLFAHLAAMIGAYISAVTAFLVINAHHVPMILRWAVPSAIGASAIALYSIGVLRRTWRIERVLRNPKNRTKAVTSPVAPATAGNETPALR